MQGKEAENRYTQSSDPNYLCLPVRCWFFLSEARNPQVSPFPASRRQSARHYFPITCLLPQITRGGATNDTAAFFGAAPLWQVVEWHKRCAKGMEGGGGHEVVRLGKRDMVWDFYLFYTYISYISFRSVFSGNRKVVVIMPRQMWEDPCVSKLQRDRMMAKNEFKRKSNRH
jgi:hypothetical protein